MPNIDIQQGQTFLDIAMQELGDAERALELAVLNGRSLTDDLLSGENVSVPEADAAKQNIIAVFSDVLGKPASGQVLTDSSGTPVETLEGIGYWIIGVDFKVS